MKPINLNMIDLCAEIYEVLSRPYQYEIDDLMELMTEFLLRHHQIADNKFIYNTSVQVELDAYINAIGLLYKKGVIEKIKYFNLDDETTEYKSILIQI